MPRNNMIYAQSGGVTSVINCSAYGVLKTAIESKKFEKIFVALNGVRGLLQENIIDMTNVSTSELEKIACLPSGFFGSCRKKLEVSDLDLLFRIFDAHDIGYFFYNGGNDSMLTAKMVENEARRRGYDLKVIGIPKTIDNDLLETDFCPGYPTTARFVAVTFFEATMDVKSMHVDSTKVFIMETMGRNAGWIVAATSLFLPNRDVQIILFPEVRFDEDKFLNEVEKKVDKYGYCVVAVSEGLKDENGNLISKVGSERDEFGNVRLGQVGIIISRKIESKLEFKTHVAIPDYTQRSARHMSSKIDVELAKAVGAKAVKFALDGINSVMVNIIRENDDPYMYRLGHVDLEKVGGPDKIRKFPDEYISEDGFNVSEEFIKYAYPLVKDLDITSVCMPAFTSGCKPTSPNIRFQFVEKKVVKNDK